MLTMFIAALATGALLDRLNEFKEALRHSDISQEKLALYLGMDKGQLSRQLNGEGGITLKRLAECPEEVWRWFAVGILLSLGLPKQLQRGARLAFALIGHKRQMAKADERHGRREVA
jgi:transcriptional regulator with XRE-family HTH domain